MSSLTRRIKMNMSDKQNILAMQERELALREQQEQLAIYSQKINMFLSSLLVATRRFGLAAFATIAFFATVSAIANQGPDPEYANLSAAINKPSRIIVKTIAHSAKEATLKMSLPPDKSRAACKTK